MVHEDDDVPERFETGYWDHPYNKPFTIEELEQQKMELEDADVVPNMVQSLPVDLFSAEENDNSPNSCRLCGLIALHECSSHCKSWYCSSHATEDSHDCYERSLQTELFKKRRRLEANHGFVKWQITMAKHSNI